MNKITCRICSSNLNLNNRIFHIPDMPLTDEFISDINTKEFLKDINIYCCDKCGFTQNPDDFDYKSYYNDYRYSTGHSKFTKEFMKRYARSVVKSFKKINGRDANYILEIGSGDGQQMLEFKNLNARTLIGVEPSDYLAKASNEAGIKTLVSLFGSNMISQIEPNVDICISSYTFDHVRQPLDYLSAAHSLLVDEGILALEIHDLQKIINRTEYCLFEHEHTIYLDSKNITRLLENRGFSVIEINPLPPEYTRGNSLIVIAKKKNILNSSLFYKQKNSQLQSLQSRIYSTIANIDKWIKELPENTKLIGFGAGGRGIMTIAALSEHRAIKAIFDSNFESNKYLSPKSRIPIVGPKDWKNYNDAYCINFSFGYHKEIIESLSNVGFDKKKIISLKEFF